MRVEIKKDIYVLYVGVEGCLKRVRESVYWFGMNFEFKCWILICEFCRLFEVFYGKEIFMSYDILEVLGESCCGVFYFKLEILFGNGWLL